MGSIRYTNMILTVLAVLLAAQLWTTWSTSSAPMAQSAQAGAPNGPTNLPDPGADRKDMIDLMKKQVQKSDDILTFLKSGQMRVRLETAPAKE